MAIETFHPVIQDWFHSRFDGPTEPQTHGWPHIASGEHTLIAAPTGSGKTLTAFLAIIDRLFREGVEGRLVDEMRVVYVSPLRALSNDMHRNLETPLEEILAEAERQGLVMPPISVGLRTGDTPSHKRAALVRRPPHIFVTTPESLFLMLTAEKSREVLRTVDTLIVDEIHALVRDKRGSHLSLSMERLQHVADRPLQRIGISATQKPIERTAAFLIGTPGIANAECGMRNAEEDDMEFRVPHSDFPISIVDVGHQRDLDLGIEVPPSDLSSVCSHEQWAEVNERLVELIEQHRSTLIFVNTRRLAERLTFQLTERLGEEAVGAHHGSLSADIRLTTEQKLKSGQLKAVVATASLELGIDVGYIDLVVQMGSPRSIATFLQRIGRSGHALGLTPKGRLFALTRDELIECMSLIRAVKAGRLDVTPIPEAPLDILAQQIVAEVAAEEWDTDELYDLCRRAYSYRNLTREQFDEVVEFLSEGITQQAGRSRSYLHHDKVNRRLRARKGARITAVNNGGAIPEIDNVRVVMEPEMTVVGSVDEDFAVESSAGDIFLLGNTSWRIQTLRGNDLIVSDAHGAPPTIPFWRGEAPGRTVELSEEVSRLREEIGKSLTGG
ncbi:MAG: DEAD/DEAH box helicase [Planctomycetaceae bacterium]|nr:DEAD/DEAH box helicase [Planctomycetaceae bacterium]